MGPRLQLATRHVLAWLGWPGAVFALTFLSWLALLLLDHRGPLRVAIFIAAVASGSWLFARIVLFVAKKVIWRLRYRLIVTYLFLAVAPVVLLALLFLMSGYLIVSQVAMNVVTTELERRETELDNVAQAIANLDASARARQMLGILDPYFVTRYPKLAVVLHQQDRVIAVPPDAEVPETQSTEPRHGIIRRNDALFLWAHRATSDGGITIVAPVTHRLLDQLAPEMGLIDVAAELEQLRLYGPGSARPLPPAFNQYDRPLVWFASLTANDWKNPSQPSRRFVIALETRVFTALSAIFGRPADLAQGTIRFLLIAGVVIFILVEIVCWIIGVNMTRTITGAVHYLYEGTQRVLEGNLSHRMLVSGKDQLADVGQSFNRMTAHLEHLVIVEKEKERMQSDLEIAREVQNQLYPRLEPRSSHLNVAAVCRPARTVSGDYFDYESSCDGQLALAIADVSGKGISAALLMASLQSSLRTQIHTGPAPCSSATIVARVNRHLCASTTLDKYATFCLGLYDEASHVLTYTNAGHTPPVLVRAGVPSRLDVNGTIVGSFPNAAYEESRLHLELGDLLLWFTDGITELENAFGDMFGDDRLIDLVTKNAHHGEQRILDLLLDAARQWCGSDDLQDDLTLLLIRRV